MKHVGDYHWYFILRSTKTVFNKTSCLIDRYYLFWGLQSILVYYSLNILLRFYTSLISVYLYFLYYFFYITFFFVFFHICKFSLPTIFIDVCLNTFRTLSLFRLSLLAGSRITGNQVSFLCLIMKTLTNWLVISSSTSFLTLIVSIWSCSLHTLQDKASMVQ